MICGVSQSNLMYGSSAFIYILFILLPIQRCNRVFLSTFFSPSHLFSVFPSHTGLSSHLSHTQPDVLCAPGSGGRADVLSVPEVFFFSLECVSAPQLTTFLKCSSSVKHKDPPQTWINFKPYPTNLCFISVLFTYIIINKVFQSETIGI